MQEFEGVVNKTLFEPVSTPHNLLPLCRATCHLSQSIRRDVTNYQIQLKKYSLLLTVVQSGFVKMGVYRFELLLFLYSLELCHLAVPPKRIHVSDILSQIVRLISLPLTVH